MKIKINRREYEITADDKFLDNGACVQLITQSYSKGFDKFTPRLSKSLYDKLKKLKLIQLPYNYGFYLFSISQESLDLHKELK